TVPQYEQWEYRTPATPHDDTDRGLPGPSAGSAAEACGRSARTGPGRQEQGERENEYGEPDGPPEGRREGVGEHIGGAARGRTVLDLPLEDHRDDRGAERGAEALDHVGGAGRARDRGAR